MKIIGRFMFIGELLQVTLFIVFFLLTANFSNYAKFFVSYFLANYSNLGNADLYLTANFTNYANFLSTLFYYSNLLNNYSNLNNADLYLTANFSNYTNFLSLTFWRITRICFLTANFSTPAGVMSTAEIN